MQIKKKYTYFILFTSVLIILNSIFFYFYFKDLGLSMALNSLIYTAAFILNLVIFLHFFKSWTGKAMVFSLFLIVVAYFLFNFAYYKVFGIFLQINAGQIGGINKPIADLLKEYYYLIPADIYIYSFFLFLFFLSCSAFYFSKKKKLVLKIEKSLKEINFIGKNLAYKKTPKYFYFIFLLLFNGAIFIFFINQKNSLTANNYTRDKYISSLGVYGNFIDIFYSSFFSARAKAEDPANIVAAVENRAEEEKFKNNIEWIKNRLVKIGLETGANYGGETKNIFPSKPHIIIYQLESVSSWPLKQEPSPMPFLSELIKKYGAAEHFFSNGCLTINAEFSSLCSFLPESNGPISDLYSYNNYYCLPEILKEKYNYLTVMRHANSLSFWNREELTKRWGFEKTYFQPYYKNREYESKIFKDVIKQIKESDRPTFNYVIGLTSHTPHNKKFADLNNRKNGINIEPYSGALNGVSGEVRENEETVRYYYSFLTAVDDTIKSLFNDLKSNDLLKNTIVIIYGDHRFYRFKNEETKKGFLNFNEIPLVFYAPGEKEGILKQYASQLDIAPSLLHIISREENSLPEYFLGSSIFSNNSGGYAIGKCLGQSFLVNSNFGVGYDNITKNGNIIWGLNKEDEKYKMLNQYFSETIFLSDKIIANNEIERPDHPTLTAAGKKEDLKIDFDQVTDNDKDGLSNVRERTIGTNPDDADTDKDTYNDGVEVINGYNPKGIGKAELNN